MFCAGAVQKSVDCNITVALSASDLFTPWPRRNIWLWRNARESKLKLSKGLRYIAMSNLSIRPARFVY